MQTSYSINIPSVAFPGQPVDMGVKDDVSALAVAGALGYGTLAVLDGANSAGFDKIAAKAPAAALDITTVGKSLGVVIADQARAQDPSVVEAQYPQGAAAPIRRMGRVWVKVEEAVVNGDQAFARFAAGAGGTQLGAFRKSADTATAAAVPGAYFRSAAGAGEFAVLELAMV